VIPDNSPAHEPDIGLENLNTHFIDNLDESLSSTTQAPLSPLGISNSLFVNKLSLNIYHLFTTLDFGNSWSDF